MDVVQKQEITQQQVAQLNDKIDMLHQLLEQLTEQVSGIAAVQSNAHNDLRPDPATVNLSPASFHRTVDPSMVHKDILSDEPHLEGDKSSNSQMLSPEVQIQRLTAQLTAAYNRMAALEEQILACRFQ
jgi:uncharacterized coiled-coil protein SlyX